MRTKTGPARGRTRGLGDGTPPASAGRRRGWALAFFSVPAALLALEVALIPFPVVDAFYSAPATSDHPIFRRQPGLFLWSRGWNFEVVTRVRVNNYGFVSDQDYHAEAATPLAAVIGDSFVEALMVPWRETCAGRLADHASPRLRVYSFGASGAPLSQYLAYAQYVRDEFRPRGMVFVVVGNDFHESMLKHSWGFPFAYFDDGGAGPGSGADASAGRPAGLVENAGAPDLVTVPHPEPIWWRSVGKRSNLLRYLTHNVGLEVAWRVRTREGPQGLPPVTMLELARPVRERPDVLADSRRATDRFFDLLPEMSGLAPSQIAFVVDGPRFALYDEGGLERVRDSHRVVNRQYFMAAAEAGGYEVLDMLPVFADHWRANGARFDWPGDGHWNALGHRLCFESVAKSALIGALVDEAGGRRPARPAASSRFGYAPRPPG